MEERDNIEAGPGGLGVELNIFKEEVKNLLVVLLTLLTEDFKNY